MNGNVEEYFSRIRLINADKEMRFEIICERLINSKENGNIRITSESTAY
jgi:hypothetical protein